MGQLNAVVLGAVAALSVAASGAAQAATLIATYTGVIQSGNDGAGLFGTPGTLTGRAFELSFTYDTSLGTLSNNGAGQVLTGGSYLGTSNPLTSASFTVNAISQTLTIGNYGYTDRFPNFALTETIQFFNGSQLNGDYAYAYANFPMPAVGATGTVSASGTCAGCGQVILRGPGNITQTSVNLTVTGFRVTAPSAAVPEPASWALMIGGFGLAGATLRRRRAALAA